MMSMDEWNRLQRRCQPVTGCVPLSHTRAGSAGMSGLAGAKHPLHARALAGLGLPIAPERPPVTVVKIPDGPEGTLATLQVMERLSRMAAQDPEVVLQAKAIVQGLPSKDYQGELQAVFDWVKGNIRYTMDPRWFEWVQYPGYTLKKRDGDCDDHSSLICGLLLALGHGCAFRAVKADPSRPSEYSHVYALGGIRAGWWALDTTEASSWMGWEPPPSRVLGKLDLVLASP